jgi:hypothetical protein
LFHNDRFSFSPKLYVNGDTYYSWNYKKSKILGTSHYATGKLYYRQDSDASLRDYTYADSSLLASTTVGGNLYGPLGWELGFATNLRRFDEPAT